MKITRNITTISVLVFLALLVPLGVINVEARPPDDFDPPVIRFMFPTRDNYPLAGDMFVSIEAIDSSGILDASCFIDGHIELPCYSQNVNKFWFSLKTTNFADGSHKVTVFVTDKAPFEPNIGEKSITVQIKNHETVSPFAQILSPADGARVSKGITYVKFKVYDDVRLKTASLFVYDKNWNTVGYRSFEFINFYSFEAPIIQRSFLLDIAGQYVIRLSVCDYAGNYAYDTIIINVI
ncbi:MAG: hypothetical protein JXA54_06435 [Candidatus Heimdallarchaeota archaeon]|nr:hypothetical protein [Candidatus Heimdallarchaeota archaeon]